MPQENGKKMADLTGNGSSSDFWCMLGSKVRAMRVWLTVAVLLTGGIVSSVRASSTEERLVTFLAGCELLNRASAMEPDVRADALRWLIAHTGITPERAVKLIERYRKRPEDWRKVLEEVRQVLEPKPDQGETE
jgi:hypothetical protein